LELLQFLCIRLKLLAFRPRGAIAKALTTDHSGDTRQAFLDHERSKAELKALMLEDVLGTPFVDLIKLRHDCRFGAAPGLLSWRTRMCWWAAQSGPFFRDSTNSRRLTQPPSGGFSARLSRPRRASLNELPWNRARATNVFGFLTIILARFCSSRWTPLMADHCMLHACADVAKGKLR
jgi:hypothetical protein